MWTDCRKDKYERSSACQSAEGYSTWRGLQALHCIAACLLHVRNVRHNRGDDIREVCAKLRLQLERLRQYPGPDGQSMQLWARLGSLSDKPLMSVTCILIFGFLKTSPLALLIAVMSISCFKQTEEQMQKRLTCSSSLLVRRGFFLP